MPDFLAGIDWVYLIAVVVALFVMQKIATRVQAKAGAKALVSSVQSIYAGDHEYKTVSPAEFGWMNLSHYETMKRELTERGFTHLEDIENLTLTRAFPATRTFLRSFTGVEGTVQAGVYDLTPRGTMRLMQMVGGMARDFRTIDLQTELTNGRFVLSTTADRKMASGSVPPEAEAEYYPRSMPLDELLEAHIARVQRALDAAPGVDMVRARTAAEAREGQRRLQRLINRFRGGEAFLTAADIARAADDPDSPAVKALSEAVEKEKAKAKRSRGG